MPSKSQRKKRKHSIQSKKRKGGLGQPTVLVQPQAASQAHKPVSSPNVPAQMVKSSVVPDPYIATELRTIGILAGIMLIVLIVLALVLS